MLVMHLQQSAAHNQNISRNELQNWYLSQKETEGALSGREDLAFQLELIQRILKRLIEKDHVLIESPDGIVVHPNYDFDNEDSIRRAAA